MLLPFPHLRVGSFLDFSPEAARALGVRGLLLDIDGTITPAKRLELPPETGAWLDGFREAGIPVFILSNNRRPARVKEVADLLGLEWMARAKKPFRPGFMRAARHLGIPPAGLAVVGDQTFTDMLGARLAGMKGVLVDSLDTHLWYFWPRRLLELPFRRERP